MSKNVVIIVDDQPINLQIIANVFEAKNPEYEIINTPNRKIALTIIEKVLPDIIITDRDMPEKDEIKFIKQLRLKDVTTYIPAIMYTGVMTSFKSLKAALNARATDYIHKPIDHIELIAQTNANLNSSEEYASSSIRKFVKQ